jgi:osmotically-inducible protein OsmY
MIKRNVVDQLFWDSRVDASDIQVKVNNNLVELDGKVPTGRAKWAAEEDARLVSGVVSVVNFLKVEDPKARALPTDEQICSSIEQLILWDSDFDESKIDVEVASGLVTLEGVVDAFWKSIVLKAMAQAITGVWEVSDKLVVVPTGDVVDEEIAKDVDAALERNAMVDRDDVSVKVVDGVVVLSGEVPNASAENAAFNSALYTFGIRSVQNELKVRC